MSNEKKITPEAEIKGNEVVKTATVIQDAEAKADEITVVEGDGIYTGLQVERKYYERDGKMYFFCFVPGVIRGREIEAGVTPADYGGYDVLDIVFGDEDKVGLYKYPYEMRDERTKKVTRGFTYKVQSQDEDGVYAIKVKPARDSDKALLEMLIAKAERSMKHE